MLLTKLTEIHYHVSKRDDKDKVVAATCDFMRGHMQPAGRVWCDRANFKHIRINLVQDQDGLEGSDGYPREADAVWS